MSTQLIEIADSYAGYAVDISARTRQSIKHCCNRFARLVGVTDATEITRDVFGDFRKAALDCGFNPHTIESTIGHVLLLLRYAHSVLQILPEVPHKGRPVRRTTQIPDVPTLGELGAMYRHADVTTWPPYFGHPARLWRCFFVLAYFTGLRRSDMLWTLRWPHIQDDHIELIAAKTGKRQRFPLHPVLKSHLQMIGHLDPERVLPFPKSEQCFRKQLHAMADAAGLKPALTCQQLRRLSATEHERAKPGTAGLLLGYSLPRVARYYVDPLPALTDASTRLRYPPEFAIGVKAALAPRREPEALKPELWEFPEATGFRLCGVWFKLFGQQLQLLRTLVDAGQPLGVDELAGALYDGQADSLEADVKRRRVSLVLGKLRRSLRTMMTLPTSYNPVPLLGRNSAARWTVTLPVELLKLLKHDFNPKPRIRIKGIIEPEGGAA